MIRIIIKKVTNFEYLILIILILGAIGVRLYKIGNPIADWHSWRQADTASVTRTYVQEGINLLYPRYQDISSIQTGFFNPRGFRFVEFPIYNSIHALLVMHFPFWSLELWGRIVSIASAIVSCIFMYLIGKRFFGIWGGNLSAFFYAFLPFNIYFTRVILPEPLAVCLGLISLWLFIKFIDTDRFLFLFVSGVFLSLSILTKPFTLFYGVPMFALALVKYSNLKNLFKDIRLLLFLDLVLVPFFIWRIWINQYPQGIPFYNWAFNGDGIRFRPAFWRWIFGERIGKLILGIWGLVPFSQGILDFRKAIFTLSFFLGMIFYLVIVATANVRHDYYQTIIIPAICLILAKGCLSMWKGVNVVKKNIIYKIKGHFIQLNYSQVGSRLLLIFSIVLMLGIGFYQTKEFYKINHLEIIQAGEALDKIASKNALVIAPYNGDTAFLYHTKRWGWPAVDDSFDNLIKRGASYYVSVNFGDPDNKYIIDHFQVIEKTDTYFIADLKNKIK